jgi:hypothetical protein
LGLLRRNAHLARLGKANDLELLTAAIKRSRGTIVAPAIQQLAAAALKAREEQVIALIEAGVAERKKTMLEAAAAVYKRDREARRWVTRTDDLRASDDADREALS